MFDVKVEQTPDVDGLDWVWRRFRQQAIPFALVPAAFVTAFSVLCVPTEHATDYVTFALIGLALGVAIAPIAWIRWTFGLSAFRSVDGRVLTCRQVVVVFGLAAAWLVAVIAAGGAVWWVLDRL